ncbi:MAG TPA: rubredoxin [Proteobacteria bacterium]|nr:rubredoxin [Pseudomonadota bacterium]
MATFKCTECGQTKDGRCKPRKCPACGAADSFKKQE